MDGGLRESASEGEVIEAARVALKGPRERALDEGIAAATDADLIAIVLGTGLVGCPVLKLAEELLHKFGGLEGLSRLGPAAIAAQPGVGIVKALRLAAALEMGRRSLARSVAPRRTMHTSAAVAGWFTSRLGWMDHEEMWSIALDGRQGMRGARRIAQGGLHGLGVTPRDILRVVLQDAASAFVLVHNHPSGDPMPSKEDLAMTAKLLELAQLVGVPLVDHVIVSSTGRYISMLELGMLVKS